MKELFIYVDGGARGNPGPSAIGIYIEDENKNEIKRISKRIGFATNNIAEYAAVVEALSWLVDDKVLEKGIIRINIYMDSKLVCSQIKGLFKVKSSKLRDCLFKIREKEAQLKIPIFYTHISREKNKRADFLVNQALDNAL